VVCSNARLSRFFFVLGQTALNSLVLAEDLSQATRAAKLTAQKDAIAAEQAMRGTKKIGEQEAEHDAEMTAAIDMEVESELFASMNLGMLVENLLAKFVPMVAAVVASEDAAAAGSYASPMLRQTATLSLCKFMSVSATLCDQYLPLLFTSLENNTDDICRTTVMVAIGDLMSRFPNALEQWTQYIYARLCDNSTVVRYNALMVLTHMLLNDMVKVKGQIVNVVLCLSDTDERIRDLSRLFFLKLAERSTNPLHNQMGEVIATIAREMSEGERGTARMLHTAEGGGDPSPVGSRRKVLTSAQYGITLDFLLSFVKVIKLADALLERTLPRLILAKDAAQKRALAQCLGKLTISPKGVKKVGENVKSLKDALCDEEVYKCLLGCVRGVKKSSAVGATASLTEDEKKACKEVEEEIVKVGKEVHLNEEEEEGEIDGEIDGEIEGDGSAETQELLHDLKKTKDGMAVDGEGAADENEAPAASKSTKKAATPAKKAAKKAPVKAVAAASKPNGRATRKKVIVDSEGDEEEETVEEVVPRSRRARKPLAASN
jgi:condensin complex subunit 1